MSRCLRLSSSLVFTNVPQLCSRRSTTRGTNKSRAAYSSTTSSYSSSTGACAEEVTIKISCQWTEQHRRCRRRRSRRRLARAEISSPGKTRTRTQHSLPLVHTNLRTTGKERERKIHRVRVCACRLIRRIIRRAIIRSIVAADNRILPHQDLVSRFRTSPVYTRSSPSVSFLPLYLSHALLSLSFSFWRISACLLASPTAAQSLVLSN